MRCTARLACWAEDKPHLKNDACVLLMHRLSNSAADLMCHLCKGGNVADLHAGIGRGLEH